VKPNTENTDSSALSSSENAPEPESRGPESPRISVVLPAYNEAEALPRLVQELDSVLNRIGPSEIVLVDDGSTDGTDRIAAELARDRPYLRFHRLPSHQGKAACLRKGFEEATGEIIVTMDADLQDDPADLPLFLAKLEEGYDLVCGWKRHRKDPLGRRLLSRIFNLIYSVVLGPRLHDHNCGFKAFRREALEAVKLYGDLHRFATFFAHSAGLKVTEIPVNHRPRRTGRSRYGVERLWRAAFDMFTALLVVRGRRRLFKSFAVLGAPLAAGGLVLNLALLPAAHSPGFERFPLALAGILAFVVGVQLIAAGLLCELALSLAQPRQKKSLPGDPEKTVGLFLPHTSETPPPAVLEALSAQNLKWVVLPRWEPSPSDGPGDRDTAYFLFLERKEDPHAPELLRELPHATGLLVSPQFSSACGRSELLKEFPGAPRSVRELIVWWKSTGSTVWIKKTSGELLPCGAGFFSCLRHLPLFFLGRYHSRPLHFFGGIGVVLAALGLAVSGGMKLSSVGTALRYLVMGLGIGFCVAGLQLAVTGLVGELLAYLKNVQRRR